MNIRRMLMGLVLLGCLLVGQRIFAQDNVSPPQAGSDLRQKLFEAQVSLMAGDSGSAQHTLEDATQLYMTVLSAPIAKAAPSVNAHLRSLLSQSAGAAKTGNVQALAALRGQIWTGLIHGSSVIVLAAIPPKDTDTASLWLPLRDFRASTRFSRPSSDATMALSGLADGFVLPDIAINLVRTDLLDTYQVQLNSSLADADEANTKKFNLRRAEESGLAAGYFEILAGAYKDARGDAALTEAQSAFKALVNAAVAGDDAGFVTARGRVDTALTGWRAVPLSDDDLTRRAGQLVRFVALIPVEYARGVRDGTITNDIEVQEALTFHEGATAAFADLEAPLAQRDAQRTKQIGELLTQALAQMHQVASPSDLQSTIDQINHLLNTVMPTQWLSSSSGSDIDVILAVLDQMENAARQGKYRQAEASRLEAYALMELGVEQRLRGFAPDMAVNIESLFWQGTEDHQGLAVLLASDAPLKDIQATRGAIDSALAEARLRLEGAQGMPAVVVGNAAIIVFREGLEAVLILASLLAGMKAADQRRFRRPLVVGAVLAFGASAPGGWRPGCSIRCCPSANDWKQLCRSLLLGC